MDEETAQRLFDELSKHEGILKPDKNIFLNMLISAEIPESSRFYEELNPNNQILNEQEQERYTTLSLRRIIRNINAKENLIGGWKKYWARTCSTLKIYSSTDLTRKLRKNEKIVNLINQSAEKRNPFSLLGKLEINDWSNSSKILYREITPILIIPEFVNNQEIKKWEEDNSIYEKEFLIFKKRINKSEYLMQGVNN